jgi:hypothetical protein
LDYDYIRTLDPFPRQTGNMVKGVQQVIRGRYLGDGTVTVTLNGNVGKTAVVLKGNLNFLTNNNFQVARLWAATSAS